MQQYIQRSKVKFKTIMEAWDDISKNTNRTQKVLGRHTLKITGNGKSFGQILIHKRN